MDSPSAGGRSRASTSRMRWSLEAPSTSTRGSSGVRPSGGASWRPRAQIARRRSPRSVNVGKLPNASWALVPRGSDGLTKHSMTGAETVTASRCRPSVGSARQRVDAEQDGLADAQRVDGRGHAAGGDHADRARVAARDEQRAAELLDALRGQLGQAAEVVLVGDDGAVAGEVDADAGDVDVVHRVDATRGTPAGRPAACPRAGRRGRPWRRSRDAAPPRRRRCPGRPPSRASLCSETSVSWTVSPASSGGGARSSQMGAVRPASRRRWAFSRRESPSALAPPASIALPTCGDPHVTLVTATTEMPGRRSTTVRAFSRTLPRSTVTVGSRRHLPPMHKTYAREYRQGASARKRRAVLARHGAAGCLRNAAVRSGSAAHQNVVRLSSPCPRARMSAGAPQRGHGSPACRRWCDTGSGCP